ncbi:MAG: hypothetical protein Q9M26_08240 [Mariprofundales bacterium]|nr:hypothetical protein [Mariprofundales bacterium]
MKQTNNQSYLRALLHVAVLSLMAALLLSGCSSGGGSSSSGSTAVTLNLGGSARAVSNIIPAQIQSFTVVAKDAAGTVVAGPATATRPTLSLQLSVPNGSGITFTLTAFDAAGKTIYTGTSTSQTLDGSPTTVSVLMQMLLKGVAAAGAPLPNTTITLRDTTGHTATVTTNASGQYTITLPATFTLPLLIEAPRSALAGVAQTQLISITQQAGVANVTILTSLITAKALGAANNAAIQRRFQSSARSITPAALSTEAHKIMQSLGLTNITQLADKNPLNDDTFIANGKGLDGVMDTLKLVEKDLDGDGKKDIVLVSRTATASPILSVQSRTATQATRGAGSLVLSGAALKGDTLADGTVITDSDVVIMKKGAATPSVLAMGSNLTTLGFTPEQLNKLTDIILSAAEDAGVDISNTANATQLKQFMLKMLQNISPLNNSTITLNDSLIKGFGTTAEGILTSQVTTNGGFKTSFNPTLAAESAAPLTTATTIGGSASDGGPLVGSTVTVTDATGTIIGTGITDSTAHYSVVISATATLPLIITITGGIDQVTGAASGLAVKTAVTSPLSTVSTINANANPLTTIAVASAIANGGLTAANLTAAVASVRNALGFGLEITSNPISTVVSGANVSSVVKANEAVAELIRRSAVSSGKTLTQIITAMAEDLTDGVLDAKSRSGTTATQISANISALILVKVAEISIELMTNTLEITDAAGNTVVTAANSSAVLDTAARLSNNSITPTVTVANVPLPAIFIQQTKVAVSIAKILAGNNAALTTLSTDVGVLTAGVVPSASAITALRTALTNAATALATASTNAKNGIGVTSAIAAVASTSSQSWNILKKNGNTVTALAQFKSAMAANPADFEAVIGYCTTQAADLLSNTNFRALMATWTTDSGASLPTAAAMAMNLANKTKPAVNWIKKIQQLAVTGTQIQADGFVNVMPVLNTCITHLESALAAGFSNQLVSNPPGLGHTPIMVDADDVNLMLAMMYGARSEIYWLDAYNWDTDVNNDGIKDTTPITTIIQGTSYQYRTINIDPKRVFSDPTFFTLRTSGAIFTTGLSDLTQSLTDIRASIAKASTALVSFNGNSARAASTTHLFYYQTPANVAQNLTDITNAGLALTTAGYSRKFKQLDGTLLTGTIRADLAYTGTTPWNRSVLPISTLAYDLTPNLIASQRNNSPVYFDDGAGNIVKSNLYFGAYPSTTMNGVLSGGTTLDKHDQYSRPIKTIVLNIAGTPVVRFRNYSDTTGSHSVSWPGGILSDGTNAFALKVDDNKTVGTFSYTLYAVNVSTGALTPAIGSVTTGSLSGGIHGSGTMVGSNVFMPINSNGFNSSSGFWDIGAGSIIATTPPTNIGWSANILRASGTGGLVHWYHGNTNQSNQFVALTSSTTNGAMSVRERYNYSGLGFSASPVGTDSTLGWLVFDPGNRRLMRVILGTTPTGTTPKSAKVFYAPLFAGRGGYTSGSFHLVNGQFIDMKRFPKVEVYALPALGSFPALSTTDVTP